MANEKGIRIKRSRNPFESPSCPETYQQAAHCPVDAKNMYHYISWTSNDIKQLSSNSMSRSRSRLSSVRSSISCDHDIQEAGPSFDEGMPETPCKQVAQLKLDDETKKDQKNEKSSKKTKGKLLGSKSLSQLMSKFNKAKCDETKPSEPAPQKLKVKSQTYLMPRQSTSRNLHLNKQKSSTTLEQTSKNEIDLSPIPMNSNRMLRNVVASTPALPLNRERESTIDCRLIIAKDESTNKQAEEKPTDKQPKTEKIKPFKNTALVLRDVKNSLRLRLKAKRKNQEFEKLTDESMTSFDSKLYSPFNIYSSSVKKGENPTKKKEAKRSKKKLDLDGHENDDVTMNQPAGSKLDDKETDKVEANNKRSFLKSKIALKHKNHLMNANKFTFNSPTGRLRQVVNDVAKMQQCIEDISEAIRERCEGGDEVDFCNFN